MECCPTCPLGQSPCWAKANGQARVCELVRGELAALAWGETPHTAYRDLVRRRSDPSWSPPEPEPAPEVPLALMMPQPDPEAYRIETGKILGCLWGNPFPSSDACGCGSARHCYRFDRRVASSECRECVRYSP